MKNVNEKRLRDILCQLGIYAIIGGVFERLIIGTDMPLVAIGIMTTGIILCFISIYRWRKNDDAIP